MKRTQFLRCLQQIYKGNNNGLRPIYIEYYEKLVLSAKCIVHDEQTAEDAASEVIMRLWRFAKIHPNLNVENVGAYLHRAVKNIAIDMSNESKNFVNLDDFAEVLACEDEDIDTRLSVEQALGCLGDEYFRMAEKVYFYGYKISELSTEFGIPEGTIKWKLSEIRRILRKNLKK